MHANADVSPLAFDRAAGARRPAAAGSNTGLGGSRHITAVAPVPIAGLKQRWQRYSPNSLVRAPLRFTSHEDLQLYRKGLRILALVYAGILMLVVAVTAFRGDWRKQDVTANATAGAIDISRRH